MKIVADIDIPFLKGVLEPYFDVCYMKGSAITPQVMASADALLIRTRTRCDADSVGKAIAIQKSCGGASLRFIASATIGTDHVDTAFLAENGITFANAPGCNAGGVMQYVLTALFATAQRKDISLKGMKFGVVGVGNTGSRVANLAENLGFKVLRNDPPRALTEGEREGQEYNENSLFYSLDCVLCSSDIISFHVPLDEVTRTMVDVRMLAKMKPGVIFINASRGEIVVDKDLMRFEPSALILDVWNGEPANISKELIVKADIATPHIAGYSYEGKINGTAMVVQALAHFFEIDALKNFMPEHTPTPLIDFCGLDQSQITKRLLESFPIYDIDRLLRNAPENFETIRSKYVYRQEFKYS